MTQHYVKMKPWCYVFFLMSKIMSFSGCSQEFWIPHWSWTSNLTNINKHKNQEGILVRKQKAGDTCQERIKPLPISPPAMNQDIPALYSLITYFSCCTIPRFPYSFIHSFILVLKSLKKNYKININRITEDRSKQRKKPQHLFSQIIWRDRNNQCFLVYSL